MKAVRALGVAALSVVLVTMLVAVSNLIQGRDFLAAFGSLANSFAYLAIMPAIELPAWLAVAVAGWRRVQLTEGGKTRLLFWIGLSLVAASIAAVFLGASTGFWGRDRNTLLWGIGYALTPLVSALLMLVWPKALGLAAFRAAFARRN